MTNPKIYRYADSEKTFVRVFDEDGVSRVSVLPEAVPDGVKILPADPPPIEAQFMRFEQALTAHLDATARQRRYTDRITCALRAGFPGPFHDEGVAFAQWMDQCNAQGYALMAEVLSGARPMPTAPAQFIALLPEMEWPT